MYVGVKLITVESQLSPTIFLLASRVQAPPTTRDPNQSNQLYFVYTSDNRFSLTELGVEVTPLATSIV